MSSTNKDCSKDQLKYDQELFSSDSSEDEKSLEGKEGINNSLRKGAKEAPAPGVNKKPFAW